MEKQLITAIVAIPIILSHTFGIASNSAQPRTVLSSHEMSLENRQPDAWVNGVFKDNILLNLAYLRGQVKAGSETNWNDVKKPFTYSFTLAPGQIFAFHDAVLAPYQGKVVLTTRAHFNSFEGFKSDGYLIGDGVCHLASLINWAARDAGLTVVTPTNHDFAVIPGIPKKYGVAIYNLRGAEAESAQENLYITNNKEKAVELEFKYEDNKLTVSVLEAK